MPLLPMRFLKDVSGETPLAHALLVTGSSLIVIPATGDIAAKLDAILHMLIKALH